MRFIIVLSIICFLPAQMAKGVSYIPYYSKESDTPVIDGNIDDSPWTSTPKNLRLYNMSNQLDYIDVIFKSIYNDTDETISIGLKIPTTASDDILYITFKNGQTTYLMEVGLPWRFTTGNDQKVINLQSNAFIDRSTNGVDLYGADDISNSGTLDFSCYSVHDGTYYNVEFSAPQNSGDTNGHDFDLKSDNSTEFFVMFYDDTSQTYYSQILESDESRDYCYINLTRTTYTLNTLLIIGSFISSILLFSSIRAWKKRKQ